MEQIADNKLKHRVLILINVIMMNFMVTLDTSVVNIALPVMSKNLSVTTEGISWIVSVYLIVASATILIFGRLGDTKGKTKIFKYGIIQFTVGSLLCGIANSLTFLIIARMIQAIGAAAAMAPSQGIITQIFPGSERGRALGLVGTAVALGSMTGPPLGGFIITALSWHYIFLINIPIGIIIFFISIKILPTDIKNTSEKLDVKGAFLLSISILILFGSLILNENKNNNNIIFFGLIAAFILFAFFILIEKKQQAPLIKFDIFKNSLYSISIFCAFISFLSISCTFIIQPFYLQNTMKYSPASTGLIMMTFPVILSIFAPLSGYISDKIGSEFLTFLGLTLTSIGLFLLSSLNEHSALPTIIIFIAVMSLGNGLFQAPNNSLVMSQGIS
jgi:EmrB/QacA subfamily drug resistance transporter